MGPKLRSKWMHKFYKSHGGMLYSIENEQTINTLNKMGKFQKYNDWLKQILKAQSLWYHFYKVHNQAK